MFFFFFKQKTSCEMRISDWSADVCSSDLFLAWALCSKRSLRLLRVRPVRINWCSDFNFHSFLYAHASKRLFADKMDRAPSLKATGYSYGCCLGLLVFPPDLQPAWAALVPHRENAARSE